MKVRVDSVQVLHEALRLVDSVSMKTYTNSSLFPG